jgi:quercetin dioxygenase-like cupin family protein
MVGQYFRVCNSVRDGPIPNFKPNGGNHDGSEDRGTRATKRGSANIFAGEVFQDEVLVGQRHRACRRQWSRSHPARTAWHAHPIGQTLYYLSGVGRICIGKGPRPQAIYPGDTVVIPPDTMHWHGAAPDRLFAHLAMSENGEQGQGTSWAEQVSETDYKMEPASA